MVAEMWKSCAHHSTRLYIHPNKQHVIECAEIALRQMPGSVWLLVHVCILVWPGSSCMHSGCNLNVSTSLWFPGGDAQCLGCLAVHVQMRLMLLAQSAMTATLVVSGRSSEPCWNCSTKWTGLMPSARSRYAQDSGLTAGASVVLGCWTPVNGWLCWWGCVAVCIVIMLSQCLCTWFFRHTHDKEGAVPTQCCLTRAAYSRQSHVLVTDETQYPHRILVGITAPQVAGQSVR